MKVKKLLKRAGAVALAALTVVGVTQFLPKDEMVANAGSESTIAKQYVFSYAAGKEQVYTADIDGKYTIELAGGAGGNAGHYASQPLTYLGGRGGLVKFTIDLKKGDKLYMYVGNDGRCDGDKGYTTAEGNGTTSYGGNSAGSRAATGGGATEIRRNGTGRNNILAVAGGGGGGNQPSQGKGTNGLDAGCATAGNNGNANGTGSAASNNGAGGGGGYIGGTAGTSTAPAHGGSNYVAPSITVNTNGTNPDRSAGYVIITQLSTYQLMVDPNGGSFKDSDKVSTYTLDNSFSWSQHFGFVGGRSGYSAGINGSVQSVRVPKTGYYYIEAKGASGGSDATSGGKGGYVKSYTFLNEGQTLYIAVGGRGGDNVPMASTTWSNAPGWNGGAIPGDGSGGYSGGGGGATHVALSNHGELKNYANCKNDVLVVAGGGSGGSASSAGEGGTVLYAGTGTSSSVVNGASTARLAYTATSLGASWSYFGQGQNPGTNVDGGGGAGGWVGGRRGLDAAGNSSGGGASFVNTSNNSICVGLQGSNHTGDGECTISYKDDMVVLPNPVREGYTFTGWTVKGNGTIIRTVDGQTAFTYAAGLTTLTANWTKNAQYGVLKINPNGGYWNNVQTTSEVSKQQGTNYNISAPYRYGYVFKGWTLSGEGTLSGTTYKFTTGTGTVTANWEKAKTTLTVNPQGGTYQGSTGVQTYSSKEFGSVQSVGTPSRVGYNFQYWNESLGSDGYLAIDGWHFGTNNANLDAVWKPITYTIHYEANCPEGLTVKGSQPDQTHTYDQAKALATNAEYNDPTGYKIDNVKFLWWNTKPDGSGKTYKSGETVKNLTTKQGDVITLYAQWMVKYTVNHYTQNLDGTYKLADTDDYWLIPLTQWTAPLHEYAGWYQPESKPMTVATTDTTLNFYYDLIHYKLEYDTQGGEWFEEQSDGTWIELPAPPSEYTVLTPDIKVTRPDKVGYDFTGWTGTGISKETLDVVIPKGSLGDRSYTAHWEAQAYDIDIPVSLIFSVGHDGYASGVFDQNGDGNYDIYGYMTNNSLFPVQVTDVTLDNNGSFVFTHDRALDPSHPNLMNFRLDAQNGAEWNEYAPDIEDGIDTSSSNVFWMAQNGNGQIKFDASNAWAIHDAYDIKDAKELGHIVWTFGIGHRQVSSRPLFK